MHKCFTNISCFEVWVPLMALGDLILFLTSVCQEQFDPWQRANSMSHSMLMSSHLMKYYINELSKKRKSGAHNNFICRYDVGLVCPTALCLNLGFVFWIWVQCTEYSKRARLVVGQLIGGFPCGDDCEHGLPVRSHVAFAHTKSTDSMCIIMWQLNLEDFCAIERWLIFVIMGKWLHIPTDLIHMYWCVAQWIWRVSVHLKWLWIMWTWLWFHHNLLCNWPELIQYWANSTHPK